MARPLPPLVAMPLKKNLFAASLANLKWIFTVVVVRGTVCDSSGVHLYIISAHAAHSLATALAGQPYQSHGLTVYVLIIIL